MDSIETLRLTPESTCVTAHLTLRSHGRAVAVKVSAPPEAAITWEQLDAGLD